MKALSLIIMSAAVLVSSSAFAQGLTRAEVRQQLVEAEQNGSQYVTNASYPDVSPVYASQVARLKASQGIASTDTSAYGGVVAGSSSVAKAPRVSQEACVGPISFCNLYAGS